MEKGIIRNSREMQVSMEEVFDAFKNPKRLARWWGPTGFTNTFNVFEFKNGGKWSFMMHGPDGKNYPNESVFLNIEEPHKIVIDHVCEPRFVLTSTFTPSAKGVVVSWSAKFENEQFLENAREFITKANEQNFDRLTAEVLKHGTHGEQS